MNSFPSEFFSIYIKFTFNIYWYSLLNIPYKNKWRKRSWDINHKIAENYLPTLITNSKFKIYRKYWIFLWSLEKLFPIKWVTSYRGGTVINLGILVLTREDSHTTRMPLSVMPQRWRLSWVYCSLKMDSQYLSNIKNTTLLFQETACYYWWYSTLFDNTQTSQ